MPKPKKSFNDEIAIKDIIFPLPYRERSGDKFLPILLVEDGAWNFFTTIPVPVEKFSLANKKTLADHNVKLFAWPALTYMGQPRGIKVYINKLSVDTFIRSMVKSNDPRLVEINMETGESLAEKAEAAVNATKDPKAATTKNPAGKRIFSLKGFCMVVTEKFEAAIRAALVDYDVSAEVKR